MSAVDAVAASLRARRSQYGLSQAQVAVQLGLTRSSVTNFEAGRQDMPLSKVLAYAETVGVRLVPIPKEFLG